MIPALGFVVVISLAIWFFLFSGRIRTATPSARKWLAHAAFIAFFIAYAGSLIAWLGAGLIAGVAHHSATAHEWLHDYGGAPDVVRVDASDAEPFSIEGSRRIREITLRAGGTARIDLTVSHFSELGIMTHNISIWQGTHLIFRGEGVTPPAIFVPQDQPELGQAQAFYRFPAPAAGIYFYRCDFHPRYQHGTVRVLPASAHLTDSTSQGLRDVARRLAEVSHQGENGWHMAADYLFSAISLGLGIFLVVLRPRERAARVFGVAMLGTAAAYNLQAHSALAVSGFFDFPVHTLLHPITGITYIYALVCFPDGKLVPQWSNKIVRALYRTAFFFASMTLLGLTGSITPDYTGHPAVLVLVFGMLIPLIGIAAQTYRLHRATTSEARQQSRLLVWVLALSTALGLLLLIALGINLHALIHPSLADPTVIGATDSLAFRVFQPLFVVIPIALFAGIMRYRLWDIDLVINRALVYGALAGIVGALYVGIVVGLGGALGGQLGLSLAVTVVVALAFDPLRAGLQRIANRLVYGERASPYEVMADASHRLADAGSAEEMLAAVAEAAGRGVGASRARARLTLPSGSVRETSWPAEDAAAVFDRLIEVSHQGELIGDIAVAKRPGDPLRPAENRLLEALGAQVAPAMQSVRLAEQLRTRLVELQATAHQLSASRRRLVRAADAERRRLEQEIHHGVEHELLLIEERLAEAERATGPGNGTAAGILEGVAEDANRTQESLRDLARGIFPPLLSDRGVVSAIESQIRKLSAPVELRVGALPERFDPRSEAAVYFCCVEALRRVRGAAGRPVTLALGAEDGWITFALRDGESDGPAPDALESTDLQALEDRVEAVGGSLTVQTARGRTEVVGRVPAQVADPHAAASLSGSKVDLLA